MSDPVVPSPDPNVDPSIDSNPEALVKKTRELLGEVKKSKERLKALEAAASVAGIDPADPVAFITRRESETRAKVERESRVRDAVKDDLLERGTKLDKRLVSAIVQGAVADPAVTLDENGGPSGVTVYVDSWLSALKGQAPKATPGLPDTRAFNPPIAKPGSAGTGDRGNATGVAMTFADLAKQGPQAVAAFAERNPARYAELRDAHHQALQSPMRLPAPK